MFCLHCYRTNTYFYAMQRYIFILKHLQMMSIFLRYLYIVKIGTRHIIHGLKAIFIKEKRYIFT